MSSTWMGSVGPSSLLLTLQFLLSLQPTTGTTPIYQYLKDLCPEGLMPITGLKSVRTCEDSCPAGSKCVQGICCAAPPTCKNNTYKYPTSYPCLPSTKQNCPKSARCVRSTRGQQHICCAQKPQPKHTRGHPTLIASLGEQAICPSSHPIAIQEPRKGLLLCKDCTDGICVQFRRSDVMICCQSHENICGEGSLVERKGPVAKDCSVESCAPGFECTLSPTGQSVCCAMAICANGEKALRLCAGGCADGEKCETIHGERWCCPLTEAGVCPDGNPGEKCSPTNPRCSEGEECMETGDLTFVCCPVPTTKKMPGVLLEKKSKKKLEKKVKPNSHKITTEEPESELEPDLEQEPVLCMDGTVPLGAGNLLLECPSIGVTCPKNGFTCQETTSDRLFCCPSNEEPETTPRSHTKRPKEKKTKTTSTTPSFPEEGPEVESLVASPTSCPFSYEPAKSILTGKIRICTGFLDFTCPIGYTCMPSATTAEFICCTKTNSIHLLK